MHDCILTFYGETKIGWCDTHERTYDMCEQEFMPLYEVQISGVTADLMLEAANLYDPRRSPIKVFLNLENTEAIALASENPDLEIKRAKPDWML